MISLSNISKNQIFKKQTVGEAAILLTLIIFLGKIIGYFREALIANYFGVSGQTDAFLVALLIPWLAMSLVSVSLTTLIVPVYLDKKRQGEENAKTFINQIFLLCFITFTVISVLIYFFAPLLIKLIAFGFTTDRFNLAVQLLRYLVPLGFVTAFSGFFVGLYQAKKQFLWPALVNLLANVLVVMSLIFLTSYFGINSWTIGWLFFAGLSFFALLLGLWKKYHFFQNFSLEKINWSEMKQFFYLVLPLLLINGVNTINQIVDKTIASSLQIGAIAVLNFAQKIYLIPLGLLIIPLVTAVYPTFSALALDKEKKNIYAKNLRQYISLSWYFIIPIIFTLIILARPIIRFFFQRGAFDAQATILTAQTMAVYSIGLFAYTANLFLSKVFFSFKNTTTPLLISVITVAVNIICSLILSKLFGVAGIALATIFASLTCFSLYIFALRRYFHHFNFKFLLYKTLKFLLISLPIIVTSFLLKPFLASATSFLNLSINLLLTTGILVFIYLLLSYLLDLEEFKIIFDYLKKRVFKKETINKK